MIIKNDAIFVADSHYSSKNKLLFEILSKIESNIIKTSQLFLMGDIFDFLCSQVTYFKNINQPIISLINKLSQKVEINYFEGNHDFNLEKIFPKINIIERSEQPVYIKHNSQTVALAHGDIFTPFSYNIFTAIIRSPLVLTILNTIDVGNWLTKMTEEKLLEKSICQKQKNFEEFVISRVKNYKASLVIEGHYHQGYISENYINIPSLACDRTYMKYKNNEFKFIKV